MKCLHIVLPNLLALSSFFLFVPLVNASTLQVGPGKQYATPCAAIAAASVGDTIQIDTSGNYAGDVCEWNTDNLTLIGVGSGRAVINAAGNNSQRKAIWVISGHNTTVENIEFTGATVPDMNGAGIRAEGSNLTIRNCYFHDNQEGILTGAGNSTILVEYSEFYHNGAGDGFSHNLYIGNVTQFIFRYNYSHGAVVGHLLKSRAAENDIYSNRFSDEATGTASYEIDLPNGGRSFIIGNLIEKGPQAQNNTLVSYQEEGAASNNPDHELFVVNNTMVNDLGSGTFVSVAGSVTVPAVIKNNILQGAGLTTTQASAIQANNFTGNAELVNPTNYDYHLKAGSPAIDAGVDPGQADGISLTPAYQYVHASCSEGRTTAGSAIDTGAYEFNGGNGIPPPNAPSRCGSGTTTVPSANLSADSLAFAGQAVHTASPSQNIRLTSSGNATLDISSISTTGDFSQTNNCGASLGSGASCSISVTFKPSAGGSRTGILSIADNSTGSPQTVTLSGTGMDFSLSASPASATVNAGQSANFTVTIRPDGGFDQAISFTCGSVPIDATCKITPSSMTPSGSAVSTVAVSITTTARSTVLPGTRTLPTSIELRLLLAIFVLGTLFIFAVPKHRRFALGFCCTTLLVALASGCAGVSVRKVAPPPPAGGMGSGTPTGSYALTVAGTSGSITRKVIFTLTVN